MWCFIVLDVERKWKGNHVGKNIWSFFVAGKYEKNKYENKNFIAFYSIELNKA